MAININKLVTNAFPDKIFEVNAWVLQSFLYKQFIFMLCPKISTWLQDGFCDWGEEVRKNPHQMLNVQVLGNVAS